MMKVYGIGIDTQVHGVMFSMEYLHSPVAKRMGGQKSWPVNLKYYANHIADRFDLRETQFNTKVTSARLMKDRCDCFDGKWRRFHGRFCVMATGCLSMPNTPIIEGADQFWGHISYRILA